MPLCCLLLSACFATSSALAGRLALPTPPPGWELAGEPATFNADNLYEHIDGAAPGYLRYDFRGLTVWTVDSADDPKRQIVVEVYEFGKHLDAFGIYSNERGPGLSFVKLGAEGYFAGPACRFYKGRYYVKLNGSREDEAVREAEEYLARRLARRLKGDTTAPAILRALPPKGLVAGSERYEGSDLLAHDFLGAGFTADYDLGGGKPSKLFFALKPTPREARAAYDQLVAFIGKRGEVQELPLLDSEGTIVQQVRHSFYGASLVGCLGDIVCGVLRVPSPEPGMELLQGLVAGAHTMRRR